MTSPFEDGIAFVEGVFCPIHEARISLLDWGFLRSDACQDTISVWNGVFFRLDDHLERFERSFSRLRMTCPHDRAGLRALAIEAVRLTGFREAYLQLIMTRGRPPIGSRDLRLAKNNFFLFCIPYISIATPEQQEKGLHLVVSDIQRIPPASLDPTIKTYHWLDFEMGLFEAYDRGGDTVVLTDQNGNVTEGPGLQPVRRQGRKTPHAGRRLPRWHDPRHRFRTCRRNQPRLHPRTASGRRACSGWTSSSSPAPRAV